MNYELALKLKNAGFPQIGYKHSRWLCTDNCLYEQQSGGKFEGINTIRPFDEENTAYSPTLEELIEACEKFPRQFSLYGRDKDRWEATSVGAVQPYGSMMDASVTEYGSTPLEAVANLWIAINKHD